MDEAVAKASEVTVKVASVADEDVVEIEASSEVVVDAVAVDVEVLMVLLRLLSMTRPSPVSALHKATTDASTSATRFAYLSFYVSFTIKSTQKPPHRIPRAID